MVAVIHIPVYVVIHKKMVQGLLHRSIGIMDAIVEQIHIGMDEIAFFTLTVAIPLQLVKMMFVFLRDSAITICSSS